MKRILATLLVLGSCGQNSGGGKKDPEVGGEEKIKDSFFCQGKIEVPGKDDEPDPVRGFELSLTAFVYGKGSLASTLKSAFIFKDKSKYEETVSGVFAQDEKAKIETDFLVVKIDREKSAEVYPKYELGQSYELDCK